MDEIKYKCICVYILIIHLITLNVLKFQFLRSSQSLAYVTFLTLATS